MSKNVGLFLIFCYIFDMLSVIIPSYKDLLLIKTIDSLLENSELGDQLEIIAVLDGYWPTFELRQDSRVRYVHLGKNRGIRGAINAGVAVSRGEFLMRNDEHQTCGKGYDRILTETCEDNWIVTPRRYFLDPVKWEVMDIPPVDFMRLEIRGGKLMVNKNTWHAHKHRDFPRTHNNGTPENPSNNEQCFAYSLSVWKDYFLNEIKPKWKI